MEERTVDEGRIVLGDILTPQEHNWIGSTFEFNPTAEEEWYIPYGVLRGKITREQAIEERQNKDIVESMLDPLSIVTPGTSEAMVISLEEIDPETGQTMNDPRILGIADDESIEPKPVIDEATGKTRNLTEEFINKYREKGLEKELHLRPRSIGEGQEPSLGEGDMGYRK